MTNYKLKTSLLYIKLHLTSILNNSVLRKVELLLRLVLKDSTTFVLNFLSPALHYFNSTQVFINLCYLSETK